MLYQNFLVTGAMGFIGSHFCEYLLKKNVKVIGLDLSPTCTKLLEYENFTFVGDSVKNYDLLKSLILKSDVICHFAGIASPDQYVKFPLKVVDITALASLRIAEMCRGLGKLFFFTSTSEIYGRNISLPFSEDDDRLLGSTATNRWCYSTSKAVVEHYLLGASQAKELSSIIVRLFNVYGSRLSGRVVSTFIENALTNKDIIIHGDGLQTRSFTFIEDVMEAFWLLINAEHAKNSIFNIGNTKENTITELAEIVKKSANSKSKIKYISHQEFYGGSYEDIPRRTPDISKIKNTVDWEAKTNLEEGIKKLIEQIE